MKLKTTIIAMGLFVNLLTAEELDHQLHIGRDSYSGDINTNENSIALALINSSSIYKTKDDISALVPILNYTIDKFYIDGYEIGYKYNDMLSLIGQVNFNSVEIEGIDDRKSTFETGLKLTYENEKKCKIVFKTVIDTLNKHKGYQAVLNIGKTFVVDKFTLIPNIGLEYQDKKYSDYYFGVDKHESYSKYEVGSTFNSTVGLISSYTINKDLSLNFVYNYRVLDKEISNSSIVKKDYSQMTALSLSYKF